MQKRFRFLNKEYALEINASADAEGEFKKCPAIVSYDQKPHQGTLKFTPTAWDAATRKSQERNRPLEEVLEEAGIAALKAELYIRQIPDGFTYLIDHRFFENP